ncbi:arginine--tRNA ligase [Streptomyces alkaliphilus]|uniref:Arginine--tRNA ligase n=1 Tax=Streptomyces alkaliphilus TaxID=1472722 RepID=A0A7W3Y2S3_9ACTN|nr:arginine--tRNA ligase [Streptomyces alkaliphilus]MBB0245577.1 arginine--tRNA ligase [Streptomyces alkaliphilus]
MTEQVRSLADEVEAAVSAAMAETLPAELAALDPLVRRSDHADFQSNVALSLAKRLGEKPRDVAERLRERLAGVEWITSVKVSGPGFLNLHLADTALVERLAARLDDPRLGVPRERSGDVAVVDYSAPNVAKEMHVGHLRSTLIGDSLVRVLDFLGTDVVRQNHIGDWGTQFGMLIQYLTEHPETRWRTAELDAAGGPAGEGAAEAGDAVSALDSLYREARKVFDADPAFKERAQRRVVALQGGDEETVAAWREIVTESEAAFQRIYARLGVLLTLDDVAGESFYNTRLQAVVDELREKGIVEESDGAWCVFYDDIRSPEDKPVPMIVQKADGGFGYAATDLAAVRYRTTELKANRLLYVVDARQAQHFDMLFRTARRAGWLTDGIEAAHVRNGTINGPDGRPFKTRAGGTVRLADLLDDAEGRAREVVAEKNPELTGEELDAIARGAGIAAVKYAELSTSRAKDYVFDVTRMVSFSGQTGVYLQYTHTRIASILRRAGEQASAARFDTSLPLERAERELALAVDEFGAVLNSVAETLEPHRLAGWLYTLAKAYTDFYENCPVLRSDVPEEIRTNRLALCRLTGDTLARGLSLLGIAAPDRM